MADTTIVGTSAPAQQLRTYLAKLAASDANVFVTGETGSGKECVARYLHAHSARRGAPLVCVNCAAIPDGLFESELFGYERGAFTGAATAFTGQFRRAQGGTLFLDELGDMSLTAQAKVLRVLESREVLPLGGKRELALDIRVVAATNTPPERLLQMNRLRADLYYRLNVARVNLPPLRARHHDVLELFHYFVRKFKRPDTELPNLSTEAIGYLLQYSWPGNVRELRNLVERMLIDPPQSEISLFCLRALIGTDDEPAATATPTAEQVRILQALLDTRWNKRAAAEKLQWSRMTLYRKMAKYRIVRTTPDLPAA